MKIRGRILSASGRPFDDRDVAVAAFLPRAGAPVVTVRTNPDASFEVDLPDGEAYLLAHDYFAGTAVSRLAAPKAEVDLVLERRRSFQGRVVDTKGAPCEGVTVSQGFAFSAEGSLFLLGFPVQADLRVRSFQRRVFLVPWMTQPSLASTDADGSFRLEIEPPCEGKILLRLMKKSNVAGYDFDLTSSRSLWVDADRPEPIAFRDSVGVSQELESFYPLPEGGSVETLREDPPDPALLAFVPAKAPPDPRVNARDQMLKLRQEACAECGGHPPNGRSQRTDLIPKFVTGLNDPDHEVRAQSICALAYMNAPECLEPLIAALENQDGSVRHYALMGLEWLGAYPEIRSRVIDACRHVVEQGDSWIHIPIEAADTLVKLGDLKDSSLFFEALRREDANHSVAADALADLGCKDAVELIVTRMQNSANPYWMGKALEKLTGQAFGDSAVRWRTWLDANRSSLPPQEPVEDPLRDPHGLIARAQRRYEKADWEGALLDVNRTVSIDPKHAPAHALRAWLMSFDDLDAAMADITRAFELDPRSGALYSIRAHILERRGDKEGAIRDLRQALTLLPTNSRGIPEIRERLRELGASQDPPCERCGAPAPYRVTEISSGTPREVRLCESCSRRSQGPNSIS